MLQKYLMLQYEQAQAVGTCRGGPRGHSGPHVLGKRSGCGWAPPACALAGMGLAAACVRAPACGSERAEVVSGMRGRVCRYSRAVACGVDACGASAFGAGATCGVGAAGGGGAAIRSSVGRCAGMRPMESMPNRTSMR